MAGEMFQFGGEKYKVSNGEDGLIAELLKAPASEKRSAKKK